MKTHAMAMAIALLFAAGACSSSSSEEPDTGTSNEAGKEASGDDATDDTIADDASPDTTVPDAMPDASKKTWVGEACPEKGASCTDESEEDFCLEGGYWVWGGGYCTMECSEENPEVCPEGSHCSWFNEDGPNKYYCIRDCKKKSDCRAAEGYKCDGGEGCIYFP